MEKLFLATSEESKNPLSHDYFKKLFATVTLKDVQKNIKNPEFLYDLMRLPSNFESIVQDTCMLEEIPEAVPGTPTMIQSNRPRAPLNRNQYFLKIFNHFSPQMVDELMDRRQTSQPDSTRDFENVLKQIDADYLLRSLTRTARKRLNKDTEQWAVACMRIAKERFYVQEVSVKSKATNGQKHVNPPEQILSRNQLNISRLKFVVDQGTRRLIDRYEAEATEIARAV